MIVLTLEVQMSHLFTPRKLSFTNLLILIDIAT
jgi:hypothetical protein